MKTAICKLKSLTPTTFGKFYQTPKLEKELADAYEKRTWKERAHYTDDNHVKIPGVMFANAIRESAKFLSIPVPGKGKANYTKHFDAGIFVMNDVVTNVSKDKLEGDPRHVPSDGRPGGTTRVMRIFPIINNWEGSIEIKIGDDIITADVFETVMRNAGSLIGIGTYRPRNRGYNGRFELVDMKWKNS